MTIRYRINWTWDSWVCDPRDTGSFVREYTSLIDALAIHGFDALIIWGFLRDSHGGVEAAREVAAYAKARGIRILPGIGVLAYGGVYNEGAHEFNLGRRHAEHPRARGIANDGRDTPLCPSKPENTAWMEAGVRWLFQEIPEIGGVHFETGDIDKWICVCEECSRATAFEVGRGGVNGSIADMVRLLPSLGRVVKEVDPDAWNTYATYNCFWYPPARVDPRCRDPDVEHCVPLERLEPLREMPVGFHTNWCEGLLDRFTLLDGERPPTPEPNWINTWFIGGYHLDDQVGWGWQGAWTHRGFFPHVTRVHDTCVQLLRTGVQGFNLEGGYHPSLLDNALTLAAFRYFCDSPTGLIADFAAVDLAARWGGEGAALLAWVLPYEDWVWDIHAATYHLHKVAALGSREPWPEIRLDGAIEANRLAEAAARAQAERVGGELRPMLEVAATRLWEQSRVLERIAGGAGTALRQRLAESPGDPAIDSLIDAVLAELAGLPECWLVRGNSVPEA